MTPHLMMPGPLSTDAIDAGWVLPEVGAAHLGKVDLNAASLAELCTLPGIGRSRAERIVKFRAENGPLSGPEALLAIQGIGRSVISGLSDLVA